MNTDRLPSFLGSLCLHLGLLVAVLFWPAPEPPEIPPGNNVIIAGLVSVNPLEGKNNPNARRATPKEKRGRDDVPKDTAQAKPQETPQPKDTPKTPAQETPKTEQAKPTEKTVRPEQPDPNAVPVKKDPVKETRNATAKAPDKNATAKATATNATAKTPPAKNATKTAAKPENVKDALGDLRKQTSGTSRGSRSGASKGGGNDDALSSGLADLSKELGGSGDGESGHGAGSKGGTGVGIAGAYEASVVSRVRPNWSWVDRADRKNYTAIVNIKIAPDGTIESARVTSPSGNPVFDSSVVRAILATKELEPPTRPEFRDMDVMFDSNALGAR